jgi:hypothetical protein
MERRPYLEGCARDPDDAGALKLFVVTSELSPHVLGNQRRFPEVLPGG